MWLKNNGIEQKRPLHDQNGYLSANTKLLHYTAECSLLILLFTVSLIFSLPVPLTLEKIQVLFLEHGRWELIEPRKRRREQWVALLIERAQILFEGTMTLGDLSG